LHWFHYLQEYRGIFEKDRALSRRFQKIDVTEPDVETTYQILRGLKSRYEEHHELRYTDKALRAAAELAARYINDRYMPDKAIDVIDEPGPISGCKLPTSARTLFRSKTLREWWRRLPEFHPRMCQRLTRPCSRISRKSQDGGVWPG